MSHWLTRQKLTERGIEAGEGALVSSGALFFTTRLVIGPKTRIDHGCILTGDVVLGARIHLAPYCICYGKAGILIGDYSGFGAFTVMHSESDDYSGASMFGPCVPANAKRNHVAPIRIGRGVITGTRTTILPGVEIGDGVSVGAHSLVKANCLPWMIYAGVPARAIRAKESTRLEAMMDCLDAGGDPWEMLSR